MNRSRQPEDDTQLVKAFQAGDRSAFDKLVLSHKDSIFNLCYRYLGDDQEANDSAQETFFKAFKGLKRFRLESKFTTWLYRIAVNTCKNRLKSSEFRYKKRMVPLQNPGNPNQETRGLEIEDESLSPNGTLERKERITLIQRAIDSLPEEQKSMIILRDIEGLSYDEIADLTGRPLGTVKSKLSRARLGLREKLRKVI